MSGKDTYKGINAQSWAAMSLFLQYINNSDLSFIGFESKGLEDFYLSFSDGRKVICESKSYKLNYSHVRKVLEKIHNKGKLEENDQIIIICGGLNSNLKRAIETHQFYAGKVETQLSSSRHKFKSYHLDLLLKTKFWEVNEEVNYRIVYAFMAKLIGIWLPESQLEDISNNM